MPKGITIRCLVSMLSQLKYMVVVTLTRLGLFKPSEEGAAAYTTNTGGEHTSSSNNNNYVLMLDGSSPSLVPVPVPLIAASIKKWLPVVQYGNFLERRTGLQMHGQKQEQDSDGDGDEVLCCCAVCWDCIEKSHQIRELSNCCHVFHQECLDRWVDEGQVTCPLCRSMLLPAKTSPWMVLRNAHLPAAEEEDQIAGTT